MPSVLEYTLGKCYVCRVLDIMHSANRKHSAFSPFPVVRRPNCSVLQYRVGTAHGSYPASPTFVASILRHTHTDCDSLSMCLVTLVPCEAEVKVATNWRSS